MPTVPVNAKHALAVRQGKEQKRDAQLYILETLVNEADLSDENLVIFIESQLNKYNHWEAVKTHDEEQLFSGKNNEVFSQSAREYMADYDREANTYVLENYPHIRQKLKARICSMQNFHEIEGLFNKPEDVLLPVDFVKEIVEDRANEIQEDLGHGIDLSQIDQWLQEMIGANPPFNNFHMVLVLEENHPLTLKFVNKNQETQIKRVAKTDINLDAALDIKKQIQSHVLNTDGIYPLRAKSGHIQNDEFIMSAVPYQIELVKRSGLFYAKATYENGSGYETTHFHLGVVSSADNREEALDRLDLLKKNLDDNAENNVWLTRGEVVENLKNTVGEENWQHVRSEYLQGFDKVKELNAGVTLSRVCLRYEDDMNSTYRITYVLEAENGVKKGRGQNLHTSNFEVAELRAQVVMLDLEDKLKKFEKDNQAPIETVNQLTSLLQDVENYAQYHTIEMRRDFENSVSELSVVRQIEMDEDEIVRDLNGDLITVKIEAINDNQAQDFVRKVQDTFQSYIQDAYGSRDQDGLRKKPQEFKTTTLKNLFLDSMNTHVTEGIIVDHAALQSRGNVPVSRLR